MACPDSTDPNDPTASDEPSNASIGEQPVDVEQMRHGRGPGEPELGGVGDFGGHPKGLWVLFVTEMWERFSYYGMRALLVLYLVASTSERVGELANANPGFGWADGDAYLLYGVYTFMVYVTAIFGGFIADRLLGTHRSMLVGGWIIAAGHVMLAVTELFEFERGGPVSMETGPGALVSFLSGLALIIIGTGFFKPCVSVMVGQLYRTGDARRDSGFTIFYMGINLGAFLSPLIAGYLGEKVGWHWGFGSAAVGMVLGLVVYQVLRPRFLRGIGDPPEGGMQPKDRPLVFGSLALLVCTPAVPLLLYIGDALGPIQSAWDTVGDALGVYGLATVITVLLVGSVSVFIAKQPKEDKSPLLVIFILAILGNLGFWTAFEQAGSSLNVFAKESTDLTAWGLFAEGGLLGGLFDDGKFPATWFQSVNALAILLFAPVFGWLWVWLDRRRLNPPTPMKFAFGLWFLGLAFLAMIAGAWQVENEGLAGPQWLLITYLVYTWGELCLSPVGLSMVTKLAPGRLQSLMMGLWFFSLALSNLCAGLVARFSTKFKPGDDGSPPEISFIIEGEAGFYLMLVVFPICTGVLIALLTPLLRKMMQGRG